MRNLFLTAFVFLAIFFLVSPVSAYDPLSVQNNIYGIGIVNYSDLDDASNLINSNGGDWGYVTIVVTEKDRNKEVLQKFMNDCRRLHIIPIIRVASSFNGKAWDIPKVEDIDSWVTFFDSINWVIENRYIVIGNEPNHAKEWGGILDPVGYANYLVSFSKKLKNSSSDYFVLNAGFDQSAGEGKESMDEQKYIEKMTSENPDVFNFIDGWNSHSYPNPGFSGHKTGIGKKSIKGYEWELSQIKKELPVFITETGWLRKAGNEQQLADNLKYAFENIWTKDKRIVAVTPFILNYTAEPFYEFSWKNKDNSFFPVYGEIQSILKKHGIPNQKNDGEIIFKFLNPIGITGDFKKGYGLVKNTGQSIWDKNNARLVIDNQELEIKDIEISNISPYSTGLLIYSIKFPEVSNTYDVNLAFFINDTKVGEVFNGRIISLPRADNKNHVTLDTVKQFYINLNKWFSENKIINILKKSYMWKVIDLY